MIEYEPGSCLVIFLVIKILFFPLSSWSQLFFFSLQYVIVVKHVFLYNKDSVFFFKAIFLTAS